MKKIEASLIKRLLLSFEALSLFYLSLIVLDTWSLLGALWHWIKKAKEAKKKEGERKEEQDQTTTTRFFACIYFHV